MTAGSTSPADTVTPQVWVALPLELKLRAIQFLAQLAFNRVADQSGWFVQEVDHVQPAQQSQNPT